MDSSVFQKPWRMSPDNFTPATRTPWGGRVILDRIKRGLALDPEKAAYPVVGESWEISVEPSFPSRVVNAPGSPRLDQLVASDPVAALGPEVATACGGLSLLVKLLDSSQPLSVQVHPDDDYSELGPDESGKPEGWLVLASEPGAGLYLGFAEGVERRDVERLLHSGGDLAPLLNFVPVEPGDCFEIGPGTVHAVGAGVTLVEPQTVLPGRRGVTYRFWDWGRRYDERGHLDPRGRPRPLHMSDSLAVTRFDDPRGPDFVEGIRRRATLIETSGGAVRELLMANHQFRFERLAGDGEIWLEAGVVAAVVVVSGSLTCRTGRHSESFRGGESFVLPGAAQPAGLELVDCLAVHVQPSRPGPRA